MTQTPLTNLLQGIQLVQAGQRTQALSYLRYAARHENLNAEGWLWLAAASDDREEYRHCVNQALGLDPAHPVARQMRQALAAQDAQPNGYGFYAPTTPPYAQQAVDPYAAPADYSTGMYATVYAQPPSRLRRVLRFVVILAIVGGLIGGVAALILSGVVQNAVDEWFLSGEQHALEFTVSDNPGFRFRLEVPESWLPANIDNAAWRDTRDALAAAFEQEVEGSVWEQVGTSFSAAVRDQVYGRMLPSVRIVETDENQLRAAGLVTVLTLQEIKAFPATVLADTGDICDRLRAIEPDYQVEGDGVAVLDAEVQTRADHNDCILVITRHITAADKLIFPISRALAPDAMREVILAVPVGQERYALWRLTLADTAYADSQRAIERLIATLEYLP